MPQLFYINSRMNWHNNSDGRAFLWKQASPVFLFLLLLLEISSNFFSSSSNSSSFSNSLHNSLKFIFSQFSSDSFSNCSNSSFSSKLLCLCFFFVFSFLQRQTLVYTQFIKCN